MQALAIVTCTLLGFAGLLFGSDILDRRLSLRSAGAAGPGGPTDERGVAATARDVIDATAHEDATGASAPATQAPPALAPAPPFAA